MAFSVVLISHQYFYPRSPCGERRVPLDDHFVVDMISIHALLAESDRCSTCLRPPCGIFLSTLSLRRATYLATWQSYHVRDFYPRSPCGERRCVRCRFWVLSNISIHALLAESDYSRNLLERFMTGNFYPRSPCGERQQTAYFFLCARAFLSTLSLRRAT